MLADELAPGTFRVHKQLERRVIEVLDALTNPLGVRYAPLVLQIAELQNHANRAIESALAAMQRERERAPIREEDLPF
jgi:hypothetical protein